MQNQAMTEQISDPSWSPRGAEKLRRLKGLLDEIAGLFPGRSGYIGLTIALEGPHSVTFHSLPSYQEGRELLRSLGIGACRKQVVNEHSLDAWTSLEARPQPDGLRLSVYCQSLPPTCRLERTTERVPKTLVTQSNEEFIEIERVKVVCGSGSRADGEEAA